MVDFVRANEGEDQGDWDMKVRLPEWVDDTPPLALLLVKVSLDSLKHVSTTSEHGSLIPLLWDVLAEEMSRMFQERFDTRYPLTQSELDSLIEEERISNIDEARQFVIKHMSELPFLPRIIVNKAFVIRLEKHLAQIREEQYDLPQ